MHACPKKGKENYKRSAERIRERWKRTSKDNFENFREHWLEEIKKIEQRAIDSKGIQNIHRQYKISELKARVDAQFLGRGSVMELDILESKLIVALETARSRYRLENRGLWARIIEGIGGVIYRIPKK